MASDSISTYSRLTMKLSVSLLLLVFAVPLSLKAQTESAGRPLVAYVGTYTGEEGEAIEVYLEGENLMARPDGDRPLPIFPESESLFSPRGIPVVIEFRRENGAVSELIVRQGPYEESYRKAR